MTGYYIAASEIVKPQTGKVIARDGEILTDEQIREMAGCGLRASELCYYCSGTPVNKEVTE